MFGLTIINIVHVRNIKLGINNTIICMESLRRQTIVYINEQMSYETFIICCHHQTGNSGKSCPQVQREPLLMAYPASR